LLRQNGETIRAALVTAATSSARNFLGTARAYHRRTRRREFEDLPGKWQAAIVQAEQNRPKLRVVADD